MSGYSEHRSLRQRDPDRGRHGFVGKTEGTKVRGSMEAGAGKTSS